MTTLAIVEDDPAQLERLRLIIGSERDFSVKGTFLCPLEAISNLEKLAVDAILTDINMPKMDGATFIRTVKQKYPNLILVAISLQGDASSVTDAIRAGAHGYLLKNEPAAKMIERLRDCIAGGGALSPKCAAALMDKFRETGEEPKLTLTQRELAILMDIEAGMTYKETAERFYVSVHTINNQAQKLFDKLKVSSKHQALKMAQKKGLI